MAQHYSVFLSYRHKSFDGALTQHAFNILEGYRLPASLRQQGYKGVERVFRDTEELPVSRVLTDTIQTALKNSDFLVVVCSPDTPSSEWVVREVATFIELGRAQRIYPLLISGEPDSSFPPSLKKIPDIAERVMDVREHIKSLSVRAPSELLKVISAVAGCPRSELIRADKMRRAARGVRVSAALMAVLAVMTSIAAVYWVRADASRAAAMAEQEKSMEVLSRLTYELPNKLVELPSTYAAVAQILDENAAQINGILELAREQSGIREQIAANYEKHASATARLGDYAKAEESQKKAIAIYEELKSKSGTASAHNNMGLIYGAQGKYDQAAAEYATAAKLSETLKGEDAQRAVILSNNGAAAMDMGDYASAAPYFTQAIELLSAMPDADPVALTRARYNLGVCCMSTMDYARAEPELLQATEDYKALYEAVQNRSSLKPYAQALTQLALCYSMQAKLEEGLELFPRAIELLEELSKGGDDTAALTLLGRAYNNYGMCLNLSGDYAAAEPWYIKYVALLEKLYSVSGTDLDRATLARACYNVAENAYKMGDQPTVRGYFARCLSEYESVSEALGSFHRAEYLARLCYYNIIVAEDFPAALTAADQAAQLQPESSFVQINRLYALLYNKQYDACDALARELGAASDGEALGIRLDFEALSAAGLYDEHMETVLDILDE